MTFRTYVTSHNKGTLCLFWKIGDFSRTSFPLIQNLSLLYFLLFNLPALSCQSCDIGHRRTAGQSDPYDTCIACDCNSRATECDPETGVCLDCQLGTTGDQCRDCAANVQPPNCDRCVNAYFGFGTDVFGGACEGIVCLFVWFYACLGFVYF